MPFEDEAQKSCACEVVDELDIDLLVAAENRHAGTSGGAGNLPADAGLDFSSALYLRNHF